MSNAVQHVACDGQSVSSIPCPWCASKNIYPSPPSLGQSRWVMVCDDCGAQGPPRGNSVAFDDDADAECITAWNDLVMLRRLRSDAQQCDCFARSESECACGAWDEYKTVPIYRIIQMVEGSDD